MKKTTALLLAALLCVVSLGVGAAASEIIRNIDAQIRADFTVEIDGEVKHFKNAQGEPVYPILYDGTTYLPVRAIGEIMGKLVIWHENEKLVELVDKKTPTVTDADIIVTDPKNPPEITLPVEPEPKPEIMGGKVDTSKFIGGEKAKKIALEKAGLTANEVVFEKVELDRDNGVWHYEVEFKKGLIEYDAVVKAEDGTVIKFEIDRD